MTYIIVPRRASSMGRLRFKTLGKSDTTPPVSISFKLGHGAIPVVAKQLSNYVPGAGNRTPGRL